MGGFGESFGGYVEPDETVKEVENNNENPEKITEKKEQTNKKLESLTQEFVKPLLNDPILSNKIPKIIEKHQELIDKGKENPIVCLSEIISTTRSYLRQFDGDIYRQMESRKIFDRYEEWMKKISKVLEITEYGEFFFYLRDAITKEFENPETKGNEKNTPTFFYNRPDPGPTIFTPIT